MLVAFASDESHIHLVNGLPDSTSLVDFFEFCPFVTEKAELSEETDSNDQGDIVRFSVSANTYRNEAFHAKYAFRHLLIYIVTTSGERVYLGSKQNPVILGYSRRSGSAIADPNETSLNFSHIRPV